MSKIYSTDENVAENLFQVDLYRRKDDGEFFLHLRGYNRIEKYLPLTEQDAKEWIELHSKGLFAHLFGGEEKPQ